MAAIHMSEAEAAHDPHAVLAKVQQGVEMAVERLFSREEWFGD